MFIKNLFRRKIHLTKEVHDTIQKAVKNALKDEIKSIIREGNNDIYEEIAHALNMIMAFKVNLPNEVIRYLWSGTNSIENIIENRIVKNLLKDEEFVSKIVEKLSTVK